MGSQGWEMHGLGAGPGQVVSASHFLGDTGQVALPLGLQFLSVCEARVTQLSGRECNVAALEQLAISGHVPSA